MLKHLIIFFLFSNAMAEESFFELTSQLKLLKPENYIEQNLELEKRLEDLIESKNKNCIGIKQDRTQCVLELKSMKLYLIKASYDARENYLDYIHEKRKSALKEEKEKLVKEINLSKRK